MRISKIMGVHKRIGIDSVTDRYLMIHIQNSEFLPTKSRYILFSHKCDLYDELKELIQGKRDRVYTTYGMEDIDFSCDSNRNHYCIEHSPIEGVYNHYWFTKNDFIDNFVSALDPNIKM